MLKQKIKISKLLVPSDSVSIFVVIIGLLIAIFLPDTAIKFIGAAVTILGTVALFMQISGRMSDMVVSNRPPGSPPPNFQVVVKKDSGAKRIVYEDYNSTFFPENIPANEKKTMNQFVGADDDGFKVVGKSDNINNNSKPNTLSDLDGSDNQLDNISRSKLSNDKEFFDKKAQTNKSVAKENKIEEKVTIRIPEEQLISEDKLNNLSKENDDNIIDFSDDFSGMRIVGKKANSNISQTQKNKQEDISSNKNQIAQKSDKQVINKQYENRNIDINNNQLNKNKNLDTQNKEIPKEEFLINPNISKTSIAESIKQNEELPNSPIQTNTQKPDYKEKLLEIQISSLIDNEPFLKGEPGKEFEYFLSRVLKIIRSVTSTRTAVFLLVNAEKKQFILQTYETDKPDAIIKQKKISFGNDIISQIIVNIKPEILTEINPKAELDLIPYYTKPVGTTSFIGVPVFYQNSIIGILCADTDVEDAYDSITVGFLGHFTKLISSLVQSYTEKYELILSAKTMEAINHFKSILSKKNVEVDSVLSSLLEATAALFEFTRIGICSFNEDKSTWMIKHFVSKSSDKEIYKNKVLVLEKSLIAEAILNSHTVYEPYISDSYIRVFKGENKLDEGCFIAIPLKSLQHNFGALFIESIKSATITQNDIEILEILGEQAGTTIEQIHYSQIISSNSLLDNDTGILNSKAFINRLNDEFYRSVDFGIPIILFLFKLDNYASIDPKYYHDRNEEAIEHVLSIFKKNTRKYDVFGRVDKNTFGLLIAGMDTQNAKIWAEQLRSEIAVSVLNSMSKRINVTISLGASSSDKAKNAQELYDNSLKAFKKATIKGNTVYVFY